MQALGRCKITRSLYCLTRTATLNRERMTVLGCAFASAVSQPRFAQLLVQCKRLPQRSHDWPGKLKPKRLGFQVAFDLLDPIFSLTSCTILHLIERLWAGNVAQRSSPKRSLSLSNKPLLPYIFSFLDDGLIGLWPNPGHKPIASC